MTSNFETTIQTAIETGVLAGASVMAATKSQGLVYSKSFGHRSLEKGVDSEPLQIDDIMTLASGTKLITSIAALQVVERGLVGVDDDLGEIIPELGALKVLREVDGEVVLEERKKKITLRQLLSHSSGLTYGFTSPLVQKYNISQGLPPFQPFKTVTESFSEPLVAQPGTTWEYSAGIEWAGYLVTRLTGQSLEQYTQQNIASPLGIQDLTYFPHKTPTIDPAKLVSMTRRDPSIPNGNGKVIPDTEPHLLSHAKEEMGGVGLYTSMVSYIKILHSLLVNDEKLLKRETVDALLFEPQLSASSQKTLQGVFSHIQPGKESGAPPYVGTFAQFIDRQAGLCGVFGTQLLPNADEQVRKVIVGFEKAMYREFASE
ncbi:Beta-lactamase-related [Penicillium occitanis (nom. inval.)]|nr:Beta-lactamase-related [Penicillium occitanis (nom. inval.)]PCG92946.1 hypothetical protein PENOC_090120 [Penicillium occitanis (nom. inval.)]